VNQKSWMLRLGLLGSAACFGVDAQEAGGGAGGQEAKLAQHADATCMLPDGFPRTRMLLFGEMHGSLEAPAFVGEVACAYSKDGPTALGLEIPGAEQVAIDRYLESDGGVEARTALLAGAFWTKYPDGRSSAAMVDLIERMRVLRGQGQALSVFVFDLPSDRDRDAAMADAIRAFHATNPGTRIVALMGNIHASQTPMKRGDGTIITSASLLTDLDPVSMLLLYRSGSIWACMPGCGVHPVQSKWGSEKAPGLYPSSPIAGYSMTWLLDRITASAPAVAPTEEPKKTPGPSSAAAAETPD
jgi:hypothetical protein